MPAFHIYRTIGIDAAAERVFDIIADFGTWTSWSPWLGVDPEATVTVSDDSNSVGSTYAWEGALVGQGGMEHQKLSRPHLIESELRFIKPFASTSQVKFEISGSENQCQVTWHMYGNLPWFMFWMKSSMEAYVGMDYERGLKMIKQLAEQGEVYSHVEVVGLVNEDSLTLAGLRDRCAVAEISESMSRTLGTVCAAMSKCESASAPVIGCIYHPADIRKGVFDFTCGVCFDENATPPAPLVKHTVPAGQFLNLRHTGSYSNLGNAWSGAYQYARHKKLKIKKRDAYELYRNDPNETPEKDLVTDIYLQV